MLTEQLKVTGMTCGGCTSKVERTLKAVDGVINVSVSLSNSEATVQYDESITSIDQLKSVVTQAGYGVENANIDQPKGKGCCG